MSNSPASVWITTGRSRSRTCPGVQDQAPRPGGSRTAAPSSPGAHQDEVGLVGGEHQHGDVVLGQRRDDRPGDLGDAGGLAAGGSPPVGDDAEHQPG